MSRIIRVVLTGLALFTSSCRQSHPTLLLESEVMVMGALPGPQGSRTAVAPLISYWEIARYPAPSTSANPAKITFNGQPLTFVSGEYQLRQSDSIPVARLQHWRVSEAESSTPTFDDSILAPNVFRIMYPNPRVDTVSKHSGFTVSYENPGTDSVELTIWYDSTGTVLFIDSTIHHPRVVVRQTVPVNGHYTVGSDMLAAFPVEGQCQVMLIADRRKNVLASGHWYSMHAKSWARSAFMTKP